MIKIDDLDRFKRKRVAYSRVQATPREMMRARQTMSRVLAEEGLLEAIARSHEAQDRCAVVIDWNAHNLYHVASADLVTEVFGIELSYDPSDSVFILFVRQERMFSALMHREDTPDE